MAVEVLDQQAAPKDDAARVEAFVRKHFGFAGTLRLHRHAIGWDLLRAPANVALAPVFLLSRLLALILYAVGARRWARRIAGSRILFRTAVANAVGAALRRDLLGRRGIAASGATDRLIEDYTGVRSAIAEILTTVFVLVAGFALFRIATPGVITLAPVLTEHAARSAAVSAFPLGDRLGGVWYGVFSVETPVWHIVATGALLALGASLITTFAGLIADPLQVAIGLHRRRLMRLLARVDAAVEASPRLAPEHVVARGADILDATVSLWRLLRP